MTVGQLVAKRQRAQTRSVELLPSSESRRMEDFFDKQTGSVPIRPATRGLLTIAKAASQHGYKVQRLDMRSSDPREQETAEELAKDIVIQLVDRDASQVERDLVEEYPWMFLTSLTLRDTVTGTGVVRITRDGAVTATAQTDKPLRHFISAFRSTLDQMA